MNECLIYNSNFTSATPNPLNNNKRTFTDFFEADEVQFDSLTLNHMETKQFNHSHIRDFITAARISSAIKPEDQFLLLQNAIEKGNIDLAKTLIEQKNNFLERVNDRGETPLLLAAKLNQARLIRIILEKRPELIQQVDKQGNNLLHLLANVSEGKAQKTIENILMILDKRIAQSLILGLNREQQTPKQVAKNRGNNQYIGL